MATNLNLDNDLATIKGFPSGSTQWAPAVAALLRRLFRSTENPWGPNARRDALDDGSGFPIGGVMAFAHDDTAPGFLKCDGRSLSRTSYAALFRVLGTRFGSANSGVFSIPDLRRRQVIGRSTDFPVGTRSGTETKILSINEMPKHRHGHSSMTISERPDHAHSLSFVYGKNEFPDFNPGEVNVIAPCAESHAPPSGTSWPRIDKSEIRPQSLPPRKQFSGSDGAHGHQMRGAVTNPSGGGEEFSIIGPSMVCDWRIYSGVA